MKLTAVMETSEIFKSCWRKSFWPTNIAEAKRLQHYLSQRVQLTPLKKKTVRTVAGIDAAFTETHTIAVVAVFDIETMSLIEKSHCVQKTSFPYVPGYLSFREGPAMINAVRSLVSVPDILLFDGQGVAHPRRLGIAAHLGVLLDRPSIGCAKSRLVGEYLDPPHSRGGWSPLFIHGEPVGAVVRTRNGIKPLFISAGHLMTLQDAIQVVLCSAVKYRLPEPIRAADHLSKEITQDLRNCGN